MLRAHSVAVLKYNESHPRTDVQELVESAGRPLLEWSLGFMLICGTMLLSSTVRTTFPSNVQTTLSGPQYNP